MKVCPLCRLTYKDELQFCPADGTQLTETPKGIYPGQILDERYEIQKEIDAKGLWVVYQGHELVTEQKIVVKVMPTSKMWQPEELAWFRKRIQNLQKRIHPGLIRILDCGVTTDDLLYVIKEYIDGQNLQTLIDDIGAISLSLSMSTMTQILAILEFMHHNDMLHLSLSTSKIFLMQSTGDAHFVKIDGIGRPPVSEFIETTNTLGQHCKNYTAPEIISGKIPNVRCDIYSAGIILYEMITGVLPFPQEIFVPQATQHPVAAPIKRIKPALKISRNRENAVLKAIRWQPQRRFNDIKSFRQALTHAEQRRNIKLVAMVLVVIGVIGYLWQYSGDLPEVSLDDWTHYFADSQAKNVDPQQEPSQNPSAKQRFIEQLALLQQQNTKTPKQVNYANMCKIPGGETVIGAWNGDADEQPVRIVTVPAFFIDRTEITNAEYLAFVHHTGQTAPKHWRHGVYRQGQGSYPIVDISWYEASLYAAWCGKRLPTEIEWERAAHGTGMNTTAKSNLRWPWGNTFSAAHANINKNSLMAVGQFPQGKNSYGVLDMAGNVWEWTDSWYDVEIRNYKVIKGGSYLSTQYQARNAYRDGFLPQYSRYDLGFRCVKAVQE